MSLIVVLACCSAFQKLEHVRLTRRNSKSLGMSKSLATRAIIGRKHSSGSSRSFILGITVGNFVVRLALNKIFGRSGASLLNVEPSGLI